MQPLMSNLRTSQTGTSVRLATRRPSTSKELASSGVGGTNLGARPEILILKHIGRERHVNRFGSAALLSKLSPRMSQSFFLFFVWSLKVRHQHQSVVRHFFQTQAGHQLLSVARIAVVIIFNASITLIAEPNPLLP